MAAKDNKKPKVSPYLAAILADKSRPIDPRAAQLWVDDISQNTRWIVRPLLQGIFVVLLFIIWLFKRLPLPQFRAHTALQRLICWFCQHFIRPEANELILRHYFTESNILNFLRDNSHAILAEQPEHETAEKNEFDSCSASDIEPITLYPQKIEDMLTQSFVDHDQELFRLFAAFGDREMTALPVEQLDWSNWREISIDDSVRQRKWTQFIDFETAHVLFMSIFCLLLTAEEYRDAINGFKLDQSIARYIGKIIGDDSLEELAFNKHPLYLVGPWNLTERFIMHGFFTEQLHARLLDLKLSQ